MITKTSFPFEHVYFCAGARNHSLLKLFPSDLLTFEYDERIAAFMALGRSKKTLRPVAICTTSGTAVANCLPALLEAYYSELPLILITGDRPKKLHQTGAPQTIDHQGVTQSAVRTFIETDLESLQTINFKSFDRKDFPIHLNILIDDTNQHQEEIIHYSHNEASVFFQNLTQFKNPLILFSHESHSMRDFILQFKKECSHLPFYAETLSGGRELSSWSTEKDILKLFEENYFDSVLRIGHTPLSKLWRELEKKHLPTFHIDSRELPALSYGEVLSLSSKDLMKDSLFWSYLKKWNVRSNLIKEHRHHKTTTELQELISKYPLSEVSTFQKLHDKLPVNAIIYLGNSLIIRQFELIQKSPFRLYGNRGVNGIDGQLSTAIGLAQSTEERVYCLLGDITAFYDLSALSRLPSNLFLIVINNNGGRIFDLLNLDSRMIFEHNQNLQKISSSMNLTYSQNLQNWEEVQVLELLVDHQQTQHFYQEWKS